MQKGLPVGGPFCDAQMMMDDVRSTELDAL